MTGRPVALKFATAAPSKPKLETRTIEGVEILAEGKWHGSGCPEDGCPFDHAKLSEIARANNAVAGKLDPPVKLGHTDDQKILQEDGLPSAGWLSNFRIKGDKLIADLAGVPARIADLMEAGAWKKRSVELSVDFDVDGTKYPIIVTGIALLGADLPAVQTIADIESLYTSQKLSWNPTANHFLFANAVEKDDKPADDPEFDAEIELGKLTADLDGIQQRAERLIRAKQGAPTLRQLWRAYKEGLTRAVRGRTLSHVDETLKVLLSALEGSPAGGGEEMNIAEIAKLLGLAEDATEAKVLETITALKSAPAAAAPAATPEEVAALKAALNQADGKILALEARNATQDAASVVEGYIRDRKLLPAQRERSVAFAMRDPEGFKSFMETQPILGPEIGERGAAGGADDDKVTALEPTSQEMAAARQIFGGTKTDAQIRVSLMRQKAADAGVKLADNFGAESK